MRVGIDSPDASPEDCETAVSAARPQAEADSDADQPWQVPPAQPIRIIVAIVALAAGAAIYGHVLLNFWSSPGLGIHLRVPYPAYLLIAIALVLGLAALWIALAIRSPHTKLGIAGIAFLASITFGMGGGRFVSYTLRGTRNPPFKPAIGVGDGFPEFRLPDQSGRTYDSQVFNEAPMTLMIVYRGDFCPFARFELGELSLDQELFRKAGIQIIAVSADPQERSRMLAKFLRTSLPLLSDPAEALLAPLGLVQHYRSAQPDSAIPAFFLVDRNRKVRWTFTSPYYREQPAPATILDAARTIHASD